ncbi:hypothetical protein [Azospirillum argentinense]
MLPMRYAERHRPGQYHHENSGFRPPDAYKTLTLFTRF